MATAQHHRLYYLIHTFIWLYKGVVTYYWRGGEEIWCWDAVKKTSIPLKACEKKHWQPSLDCKKNFNTPPP